MKFIELENGLIINLDHIVAIKRNYSGNDEYPNVIYTDGIQGEEEFSSDCMEFDVTDQDVNKILKAYKENN